MTTLSKLILATAAVLPGLGHAGTHIWSGAGTNSLWSNAANWSSGGAPVAGEAGPVKLVFPSTATGFTSTLNIANLKIDVIEFNVTPANPYVFPNGGTPVTFTGVSGDNLRIIGTSGSVTWQPAAHLQATTRVNVESGAGAFIDFQGVVSGPGGLTKQGFGTLRFSTGAAANTFSGVLRIEDGTVRLAKIVGTPCFGGDLHIVNGSCYLGLSHQIPDTANILMEGGTLMTSPNSGISSITETLGPLTMSGTAYVRVTSPNTIALGSTVTRNGAENNTHITAESPSGQISLGGGTRQFNIASGTLRLHGNIVNGGATAGGITKTGTGTLVIMNACSYTGPVSVQEGTLAMGDNQSLGTTAGGTTVLANGTLRLGANGSGNITFPAGEALSVSGVVTTSTTAEIPGPIALSGFPAFSAGSGSTPLTLSGVLSGYVSELKFGSATSGVIKLTGAAGNTYSGLASVNANATVELGKAAGQAITGTLRFNQGSAKLLASQQIADSGSLFFPDQGFGAFHLNGFNETVGYAYGPGYAAILLGDGTLTVNGTTSVQLGGAANKSSVSGSPLAKIRKLGSNTWTFWTNVGQTGNQAVLSVEAGVMDQQGEWPGEIHCLGGTLKGGAIVGIVKGLGGNVALSDLKSTGFSGQAGGTVSVAINGDSPGLGFDRMLASGPVNLTGQTLQLTSSGFIPATSTGYRIFVNNTSEPIQGTFAGLPEGATVMMNGHPFTISYRGGDGNDVVLLFQGHGTLGPQITRVVPHLNGFVDIHMKFRPATALVLEQSENLGPPWNPLGTYITDAQGEAVATFNGLGAPKNFFRLKFVTF